MFPGRIVLLAPNLARPRSAAPPGAPTRPARGMSGFWIRQVGLHRISLVRISVQDNRPRCPGGQEGRFSPCRTEPSVSRLALPHSAPPPRRALPRPDSHAVYLGFGFDWLKLQAASPHSNHNTHRSTKFPSDQPLSMVPNSRTRAAKVYNLSSPKPEHTTGGSGRRGAWRGGGARRGRAEHDADGPGGPEANRPSSLPGYRGQLS